MNNSNFRNTAVICVGAVATILLVAFSAPHIGREPAPAPSIRPVQAFTHEARATPLPPEPQPTPVGVEPANATPISTPTTEIDSEVQNPNDSPAIETPKEAPRDNPTPTPTPSQNTISNTASAPQMGDTRIVDGQKQVYILGFGWIADNDAPNVGIYADDMYENGNKVGTMGGDEVGRSCGDINKMVGNMN